MQAIDEVRAALVADVVMLRYQLENVSARAEQMGAPWACLA